MKKALKIGVVAFGLIFIALQSIRPSFENPPVVESERLQASVVVPDDVAAILQRSCNDCHSNETVYPWYSRVSPVSWWLKDHIEEGRREMNFSIWDTYARDRKVRKLEEICEVVEAGEMPLSSYTWAHGDAVLKKEDAKLLCDWARAENQRMIGDPVAK